MCQNYEFVKQKLLEGFYLGPENYRKEFNRMERNYKENFKDYAVHLNDIFNKWLQGLKCESFEEIKQLLLLEKFYSSVPKELVAFLKDHKLKQLDEVSKLADQLDSYRD